MKILVLGATGMAGHLIALYLLERGYDVTAYSNSPFPHCKNVIGNAHDLETFKTVLVSEDYDFIINCIGLLNEMASHNKWQAVYLNSYLPHLIVDTLKSTKTRLIHMSTDCVFKGNTGPYDEKSFPDGESFYDRSKALGEIDDDKNLTFRNSIIGPDMNKNGIGLFNWFMKQPGPINGYKGAIWTGVSTLQLAKAMEGAMLENLSGLYNLVNNQSISKYDLLCLFNKYFKNNKIQIKGTSDFQLDKSLINKRKDFSFVVPSYEQMIVEMKEWIETHDILYPHYKKA